MSVMISVSDSAQDSVIHCRYRHPYPPLTTRLSASPYMAPLLKELSVFRSFPSVGSACHRSASRGSRCHCCRDWCPSQCGWLYRPRLGSRWRRCSQGGSCLSSVSLTEYAGRWMRVVAGCWRSAQCCLRVISLDPLFLPCSLASV